MILYENKITHISSISSTIFTKLVTKSLFTNNKTSAPLYLEFEIPSDVIKKWKHMTQSGHFMKLDFPSD